MYKNIKKLFGIAAICFTVTVGVTLSACQGQKPEHTDSGNAVTTVSTSVKKDILANATVIKYAGLEGQAGVLTRIGSDGNTVTEEYFVKNSVDEGTAKIEIPYEDKSSVWQVRYEESGVVIEASGDGLYAKNMTTVYFAAKAANPMRSGDAYKLCVRKNGTSDLYIFNGTQYNSTQNVKITATVENEVLTVSIPYSAIGSTKDACIGQFSFYPEPSGIGYNVNNPFVLSGYSSAWLKVSTDNKIYYDTYTHREAISDKPRPSFKNHDSMFVAVIKEKTPEDAITAIALAEAMGAQGFDLHLDYLNDTGNLNKETLERIIGSTELPILALFYDSKLSQTDRLNGLKLAVTAGAAAIDLQGFMFYAGSSANSQTEANIDFYTKQGFDMSFASAKPAEVVCDPKAVEMQSDFIKEIHGMGAEVLMSMHVKTVLSAKQAVAIALFTESKGVDIVKLVGYGSNANDVDQCIEACKTMSEKLTTAKFTYHLSSSKNVAITRIVCPVFYGSYVAFCYGQLSPVQDSSQLDLEMALQCLSNGFGSKETNPRTAMSKLSGICKSKRLTDMIDSYSSAKTDYIAKGYGGSSNLDKKWTVTGNTASLMLKDSKSTSSFNLRAYTYNPDNYSADTYISAKISGSFIPFTSADRRPKVGVYIGSEEKMLAFAYDTDNKKLMIATNSQNFGYDSPKGDRLFPNETLTALIDYVPTVNVQKGESITLAIEKSSNCIEFFVCEKNDELKSVAKVELTDEILALFENNESACNAGVLCEVYLGSSSQGRDNTLKYAISYEK